jgi:uncharacterized protein (TIGR00255 family)
MGLFSMTGYGRGRACRDGRELVVELKSVNHRFLDISYRLPRSLPFLEETLRTRLVASTLKRGHVDVTVSYTNTREDASTVSIDRALLMQSAGEIRQAAKELDTPLPTLAELLQLSGALRVSQGEEDGEAIASLANEALDEALRELNVMRAREGNALSDDLTVYLAQAETIAASIAIRAPTVPQAYRERIRARLSEWAVQGVDEQRVAQEVAIMADKCAVDEELARLNSHFTQFHGCMTDGAEVGRRMDFLLQEMNREVNTIGSKAADAEIARHVVALKCLLEKLREQVQNIA